MLIGYFLFFRENYRNYQGEDKKNHGITKKTTEITWRLPIKKGEPALEVHTIHVTRVCLERFAPLVVIVDWVFFIF